MNTHTRLHTQVQELPLMLARVECSGHKKTQADKPFQNVIIIIIIIIIAIIGVVDGLPPTPR